MLRSGRRERKEEGQGKKLERNGERKIIDKVEDDDCIGVYGAWEGVTRLCGLRQGVFAQAFKQLLRSTFFYNLF